MFLSEIPGYRRAIRRVGQLEDARREYAFLGLDYELNIAGDTPRLEGAPPTGHKILVRPLTLRGFTQLCAVRSPFFVGGNIETAHVWQILWRLNPSYSATDAAASSAFIKSIADFPFLPSVRAIQRYLDVMMFDKPASRRSRGAGSDTSFAASIAHEMGTAYGWDDETTMDVALPRLFQMLRKIQRGHDPDLPYAHPLRERIDQKFLQRAVARMNGK